jgi:fructose-specific phosphotransferase system IIC component
MAGALAGLIAWVAVDASLTIWYGFPLAMLGVGFLDNVVGGFLAGLTLGWAIRKFR